MDGRQQHAGPVADQHQHGAWRRFLQDFQQRILSGAVQRVSFIYDRHAPSPFGGSHAQEGRDFAHIFDGHFFGRLAAIGVAVALDGNQIAVGGCRDPMRDRRSRIDGERSCRTLIGRRQKITRVAGRPMSPCRCPPPPPVSSRAAGGWPRWPPAGTARRLHAPEA